MGGICRKITRYSFNWSNMNNVLWILVILPLTCVTVFGGKYLVEIKDKPNKRSAIHETIEHGFDYEDEEEYEIYDGEEYQDDFGIAKRNPGFLSKLKTKLGVVTKRSKFRSAKDVEKAAKENKKVNSLVINSLLYGSKDSSQPIKTCPPKSLKKWTKKHTRKQNKEFSDGKSQCDVTIPEPKTKFRSSSNSWEKLNRELKKDSDMLSVFPKGERPPTLNILFRKAAKQFADKYLISERSFDKLLAKIAFFKEHNDVNEVLLDHAVTMAMLARKDLSNDIRNPAESVDLFFDTANNGSKQTLEAGSDYSLFINFNQNHNLQQSAKDSLSDDPEEAKLDYWREDSLFHAFHALLHKTWDGLAEASHTQRYSRTFELFFHAHQQMVRRYLLERFIAGLPSVVRLVPSEFTKPLGPGYRRGWYSSKHMGDRTTDCLVESNKLKSLSDKYEKVKREMSKKQPYEAFCKFLENTYHATGHNLIAKDCSQQKPGPMAFSEVSARDPIFYRWHCHLEDIVQEYRDKYLPVYREHEFELEDDVQISSVSTVVDASTAETNKDLKNTLITFWESAEIKYETSSTIFYKRLNHLPFKYQLNIQNPKQVRKKMIFRIFLGILADEKDVNSYDLQRMVEMDQFVHSLRGTSQETVERFSTQSAATMKEQDVTLRRLMKDISDKVDTGTWCGIPHNLLLPRSHDFDPLKEDLGGKNFILFAVMTDVDEDINLGSDGVEHLLCGHKEINTKHDGKMFGFPFDRQLGFKITDNLRFLAFSHVKILYRSERHTQKDVAEKLNELSMAPVLENHYANDNIKGKDGIGKINKFSPAPILDDPYNNNNVEGKDVMTTVLDDTYEGTTREKEKDELTPVLDEMYEGTIQMKQKDAARKLDKVSIKSNSFWVDNPDKISNWENQNNVDTQDLLEDTVEKTTEVPWAHLSPQRIFGLS